MEVMQNNLIQEISGHECGFCLGRQKCHSPIFCKLLILKGYGVVKKSNAGVELPFSASNVGVSVPLTSIYGRTMLGFVVLNPALSYVAPYNPIFSQSKLGVKGMLRLFIVFVSFVLMMPIALGQKVGSGVTDAQISAYQSGTENSCRDRGIELGNPAKTVDAFCSCMIKTMKRNVSRSDWERLYTFASQGRDTEEIQVLERYRNQLEVCSRYR